MLLCFIQSKKQAAHVLLVQTARGQHRKSEGPVDAVKMCQKVFFAPPLFQRASQVDLARRSSHPVMPAGGNVQQQATAASHQCQQLPR